ncbi:unnamed protein product [marine sediment metagenome]|uniref:Uncharacterized protein n=1 Tax=marine sediment metagenome TaxID=412755 RepID=X1GC92_9ZZZZ
MNYSELQNSIIRRILNIKDIILLQKIQELLLKQNTSDIYYLSELEKQIIQISKKQIDNGDYFTNEEVFEKTDKWLEE